VPQRALDAPNLRLVQLLTAETRNERLTVDFPGQGGATGLNYASDYRDVGGIMVPFKRRVYAYEGNYQLGWSAMRRLVPFQPLSCSVNILS